MSCIGKCKGTQTVKEVRRKEVRKREDTGSDEDGMTSANCRHNSALRQTDVRDGEVEKWPTFSGEERCTDVSEFYQHQSNTGPH